ncbi:MAG: TonB-dependent receptor plug domain-containing protein, partial [Verrucomicrobiota bacterium]
MKKQTNWRTRTTVGVLATTMPFWAIAQDDDENDVFELSPFTVEASDNEGYRASTTLAGSRVRSNISDLGSSISVVTSEFLQDTGATDGESLLSYVGNVEVGGTQGNFSNVNLTNESTNESRNNPQRGQRVRGLVSATLTRDYFQTDIPFDSYNTERVTVNRGPNSVLFGLGSPGGIINNTTKRAYIDAADSTEVSFRVDHRGSFRANFDIARTLIEDRLAIRVAGLHENQNYKQDPAFTEDNRFYLAWNATLFKNENSNFLGRTSLRGSFEKGSIDSNPPDVVPPTDGFSSWWVGVGSQAELNQLLTVPGVDFSDIGNGAVTEAQVRAAVAGGFAEVPEGQTLDDWARIEGQFIPQTTVDRFLRGIADTNNGGRDNINFFTPYFIYPAINYNSGSSTAIGWNDPALAGIDGIMARWRPNGFSGPRDLVWSSPATGGAGFSLTSVSDRNIFDYHNRLFQGTSNEVLTDFDLYTAVIEQELFNGRAGIELAFDRQERYQSRFNPFSSATNKRISIDISEYHASGDANLDGIADGFFNENLGRPVVRWDDNPVQREWTDQDTFRATVFATLDFKDLMSSDRWGGLLGEHTVTGLYEDRTNDRRFRQTRGAWWA